MKENDAQYDSKIEVLREDGTLDYVYYMVAMKSRNTGTVFVVGGSSVYHRDGAPAYISYYEDGTTIKQETYFYRGNLHREDGPAIIKYTETGAIERIDFKLQSRDKSFWEVHEALKGEERKEALIKDWLPYV